MKKYILFLFLVSALFAKSQCPTGQLNQPSKWNFLYPQCMRALVTDSIRTQTGQLTITRTEAQPAAPTAALIATGTGNATNGSHVFAVVFNTFSGATQVSAVSNSVTVDASNKQVTITIPEGSGYVLTRDIYASKAGTTSPLYLISTSPVVPFSIANPDNNESNNYVFNIADASFTATVAPIINTAIDPDYQFTTNGRQYFGAGPRFTAQNFSFFGSGLTTVAKFVRTDPGEARLQIASTGLQDSTKFNYPLIILQNTGIVNGAGGAYTFNPPGLNAKIAWIGIRGCRNTSGTNSSSEGTGILWSTTDAWTNSANGTSVRFTLTKTGDLGTYFPLKIESVGGAVFRSSTATSGTFALQVTNDNSDNLFNIRSDGPITALSTFTASSLIKSGAASTDFLKGDGSVDASTYLTTATAASTYLPLACGSSTLTGNLALNTGSTSGNLLSLTGTSLRFSVNASTGLASAGSFQSNIGGSGAIVDADSYYRTISTGTIKVLNDGSGSSGFELYGNTHANLNLRKTIQYNAGSNVALSGTSNAHTFSSSYVPTGAASTNYNGISFAYTLNGTAGAQSGTGTGLLLNATETTLNGLTHNPFEIKVNATSVFKINNIGTVTLSAPVTLKAYTVATLPAGVIGQVAYVTDALAPSFLVTIVGGGAVVTPVFFNGANWVAN